MLLKSLIPFRNPPGEYLSTGPSQGQVYAIDSDIVLKLPFQYPIPDDVHDDDVKHYLDRALGSFVAMEKELAVYEALRDQPHPNIVRRLETNQPDCLFLERLQPLQEAWSQSEDADRHRWANELLSALSWLEHLGFAHGDLAVRNLAVDATKRLKLFDFGSAVPCDHYDYAADVKRDHFDLATCLHFILTGVDPFAEARSARDFAEVRKRLAEGRGSVEAGAEDLADVIQDGWCHGIRRHGRTCCSVSRTSGRGRTTRAFGRSLPETKSALRRVAQGRDAESAVAGCGAILRSM